MSPVCCHLIEGGPDPDDNSPANSPLIIDLSQETEGTVLKVAASAPVATLIYYAGKQWRPSNLATYIEHGIEDLAAVFKIWRGRDRRRAALRVWIAKHDRTPVRLWYKKHTFTQRLKFTSHGKNKNGRKSKA